MSKSIYDLKPPVRSALCKALDRLSRTAIAANNSLTYECVPIHEAKEYVKDAVDAATSVLSIVQEIVDDPEY